MFYIEGKIAKARIMQHFPIFLNVADRRIVVAGGAEAALAKLRLLIKTCSCALLPPPI